MTSSNEITPRGPSEPEESPTLLYALERISKMDPKEFSDFSSDDFALMQLHAGIQKAVDMLEERSAVLRSGEFGPENKQPSYKRLQASYKSAKTKFANMRAQQANSIADVVLEKMNAMGISEGVPEIYEALIKGLEVLQERPLEDGFMKVMRRRSPKSKTHKAFKELRKVLKNTIGDGAVKLKDVYDLIDEHSLEMANSENLGRAAYSILRAAEKLNERTQPLAEIHKEIDIWRARQKVITDRTHEDISIKTRFNAPMNTLDIQALQARLARAFDPVASADRIKKATKPKKKAQPILLQLRSIFRNGVGEIASEIRAENDNDIDGEPADPEVLESFKHLRAGYEMDSRHDARVTLINQILDRFSDSDMQNLSVLSLEYNHARDHVLYNEVLRHYRDFKAQYYPVVREQAVDYIVAQCFGNADLDNGLRNRSLALPKGADYTMTLRIGVS